MNSIRWHNLILILFVFLRIGLRLTAHCMVANDLLDPAVVVAMPLMRRESPAEGQAFQNVPSPDEDESTRSWFQLIRKGSFFERFLEWVPVLIHTPRWNPGQIIVTCHAETLSLISRIPDPLVHPPV